MKIWELDRIDGKKYKIVGGINIGNPLRNDIWKVVSSKNFLNENGDEIAECFHSGKILELEFEEVKEIELGRSNNGENYFYITDNAVCVTEETNCEIDDKRYNNGNYFTDFKTASKEYQNIKLYQKLKKFSVDNGWKDEMFNDPNFKKYSIYFILEDQKLDITFIKSCPSIFEVYFTSKEVTEEAIKIFGDEIKKVYGIND